MQAKVLTMDEARRIAVKRCKMAGDPAGQAGRQRPERRRHHGDESGTEPRVSLSCDKPS
jgi:hypothetical protein